MKSCCAFLEGELLRCPAGWRFFEKDVLKRLSESLKIIIVTGTNGKTTTARMIENALLRAGKSCFLNRSGANLITGITTAFLMNCDLRGRFKAEYAVVECDEMRLKRQAFILMPIALS